MSLQRLRRWRDWRGGSKFRLNDVLLEQLRQDLYTCTNVALESFRYRERRDDKEEIEKSSLHSGLDGPLLASR